MYSGTETTVQVKRESEIHAPAQTKPACKTRATGQLAKSNIGAVTPTPAPGSHRARGGSRPKEPRLHAKMRFEPHELSSLKVGQTATIGVVVENVE